MSYGMFTRTGNLLVDRIVQASLLISDDLAECYAFAERRLEILSCGEGYIEAMDTAVRETVFDAIYRGE